MVAAALFTQSSSHGPGALHIQGDGGAREADPARTECQTEHSPLLPREVGPPSTAALPRKRGGLVRPWFEWPARVLIGVAFVALVLGELVPDMLMHVNNDAVGNVADALFDSGKTRPSRWF